MIIQQMSVVSEMQRSRTSMNEYKPSMFNRLVFANDELILYNSFKGTRSLIRVTSDKKEKISCILEENTVFDDRDADITKLIQLGFLVPKDTDEKLLRQLRYLKHITDNRLKLVVHITKACNFRCTYCYMDFKSEMLAPEVQEGVINYIRRSLQKYRSVRISWFGGEPLLDVGIIQKMSKEIIELCKSQNKPYSATITTNGYNLTPENVKTLMECHVNHIAVTIDGTRDLHNKQRVLKDGSPTFDRIIENLRYLRDNTRSRTITVSIRSNITINHISELEKYYQFFDKEFGGDHRFSLFVRPVADYGGERVQSLKDSFIHDMAPIYKQLAIIQRGLKFSSNFIDLEVGGYTCQARHLYKYTIGCDGSISKCDESLDHPIGWLTKDGSLLIDEKTHANWLFAKPKAECDECFFSGSCFMELCPKARVEANYTDCPVNFHDIDALILLAAKKFNPWAYPIFI